MRKSEQLSIVLNLLSRSILNISDEDLEKIAHGTHLIELKITRNRNNTKTNIETEKIDCTEISRKLEVFSDRLTASEHLKELLPNKKSLELLARHLDIAVSKQDKTEDLIYKIIESTVGARLRSSAIRGPES